MTELTRDTWSGVPARSDVTQDLGVAIVAIAFGVVIAGLGSTYRSWTTAAMILTVLVAAAVLIRLLGVLLGMAVLLIFASFLDQWGFAVGRLNLRPEQVAVALALVAWVWTRYRSGRRLELRLTLPEIILLAWLAMGLLSSLIAAPSRSVSLKVLALFGVSALSLFLIRRIVADEPSQFDQVMRWLLLAFALESAYAIATYLLHVLGPTISLTYNPATQHLGSKGTLWEPNVLGAIAGAGAVLWAYLGPRYFNLPWLGVALCMAACMASFARAAWLAVAIVGVLTFVSPLRHRLDLRAFGFGSLCGSIGAGLAILAVDRVGNYSSAGVASAVTNSTDVVGRFYQFTYVARDIKGHPLRLLIGSGIDSFSERHVVNGVPEHLANLELFVFNDTGVIGLALFVAFSLAVLAMVWRQRNDLRVLGLGAMMLVLVITTAATETLELMITWLLIGLLLASTEVASPTTGPASARTAPGTGS